MNGHVEEAPARSEQTLKAIADAKAFRNSPEAHAAFVAWIESLHPVVPERAALQRIASADLKRCSAGWLQQIAKEALGIGEPKVTYTEGALYTARPIPPYAVVNAPTAHVDPLKPPHPSQAPETP